VLKNLAAVLGCALSLTLFQSGLRADDVTKARDIKYDRHTGYFESNKSGLKGPSSYLVFTDQDSFSRIFRAAFTMGKRPNVLPKGAFKTRMVAVVVKRGDSVWDYKVDRVTARGGVLTVTYSAMPKGGSGTARFATPLILSFDRGPYTSIVFIENGKKARTIKVSK
jgi:hypothetical protein